MVIEGYLDQRGKCSFALCQDYDSDYGECDNVLPLMGIDDQQTKNIYDDYRVNISGK